MIKKNLKKYKKMKLLLYTIDEKQQITLTLSLSLVLLCIFQNSQFFFVDDTNMNPKTYKLFNLSTIIAFYVFHMTS